MIVFVINSEPEEIKEVLNLNQQGNPTDLLVQLAMKQALENLRNQD